MSARFDVLARRLATNDQFCPLDVLLVGATGTGKSSTINALFGHTVTEVGTGADPTTQGVSQHALGEYLRLHDCAGLGDSRSNDLRHARKIRALLREKFSKNFFLIDMAVVVLDGSSRDLGTAFDVLQNVVLRDLHPSRVMVAINRADMAMKNRGWDACAKRPDADLLAYLNDQALQVQKRLTAATGHRIAKPVFYSALHGYNLDALLNHFIAHVPRQRRAELAAAA